MPEASPKKLSLFDATMLVMGGIIGVGIFFTPKSVAVAVPHEGAFLAMWAIGGVLALAGAMTFAELSATFPQTGGWFVFLREAFGRFPAFLFAWIALFVVSTGACAVIADFCAAQVGVLITGETAAEVAPALKLAIGASLLIGITLLALCGVKTGAVFQSVCMLLKLIAVLGLVFAGLVLFDGSDQPPPPPTAAAFEVEGLFNAALPVLFSYGGWQLVTYIAPSVKSPQRTLPLSLLLGIAGVVVVYLAVNSAYVRVLGIEALAQTDNFSAVVARRSLGQHGETFIVAAMAVSSLGICTAILLATPGVYVAMAREGLFFESFGRLHARTGAPVAALLLQCVVALAYFAWGNAGFVTDAVVFSEWIFHCMCGLALLTLRRTRPELPRPFKSWAYPLFPVLYALLAAVVVVSTLVGGGREKALLGLGVLALGALVYRPWRKLVEPQP